ncbi:GNAT family N-acetyltransferase [Ideonella sp. 4Y11]|uniref:GNAT family N-acetyltransferase n=1 Tax=Ideonella aquatica TaxID=2824119 RepID=A0A940YFV2_9BURK|nr:GNAT family N-acetyltransferase [Ideonella aquatica]MBQ0958584.1 GNAT family N-acetyltransferase [Ideonella aquatica]
MIVIRRIEPQEWSKYRELRLRSLQDSPNAFGSTYSLEVARPDEVWTTRVRDAAASGQDIALFAQIGSDLCGLTWCKVFPESPSVANLFQMWVAPEYRQIGIGARLLTEAIAWAASSGAKLLRLGVTEGDTPAVRLNRPGLDGGQLA